MGAVRVDTAVLATITQQTACARVVAVQTTNKLLPMSICQMKKTVSMSACQEFHSSFKAKFKTRHMMEVEVKVADGASAAQSPLHQVSLLNASYITSVLVMEAACYNACRLFDTYLYYTMLCITSVLSHGMM